MNYETIRLDKSMYKGGGSFTAQLEELAKELRQEIF